jgi:hypothetical protein
MLPLFIKTETFGCTSLSLSLLLSEIYKAALDINQTFLSDFEFKIKYTLIVYLVLLLIV